MSNGTTLTNLGLNLLSKAQSGAVLNFTKIKIGNHAYTGDLSLLTDLINPTKELSLESINVENQTTRIRCTLNNSGVLEGYYIREIGVFAMDPDEGEILYAVSNTGDNPADYIPPESSDAVEEIIEFIVSIGTSENVNTIIDGSLVYASANDLDNLSSRVNQLEQENILNLSTIRLNKDSNDVYTEIQYKRVDGTLFMKSVLSGGTSPQYTTRTVTYYGGDGTTVTSTTTYSIGYTGDDLTSEVIG